MADLKLTVDYSELMGAAKSADQTKQAIRLLGQQFSRTGDQAAYLRGVNQIVNAQKNLSKDARLSRSEIMRLGNQFRQQTKFTDDLNRAQMQLNATTQASTRHMNRMGVVTQQAGYQIGDFLVQVQGGTNPMVAFGQQATQLAGVMTLFGGKFILLGSILGITIPLVTAIGAAFMRTRGTARNFSDAMTELNSSLSATKDANELAQSSLEGLRAEYGNVNSELLRFINLQSRARQMQLMDDITAAFTSLRREMRGVFSTETTTLQRMFNVNLGQASQMANNLNRAIQATSLQDQLSEVVELRERLLQAVGSVEDMTSEQRAFYFQVLDAEDALRKALVVTGDISSDTKTLANEMSRAANEAMRFVSNLGSGVGSAQARVAGLRAELSARQGGAGDVEAAMARARAQAMADPSVQLAMQGPAGLQAETMRRVEQEVEQARLDALAGQIQSQISELGKGQATAAGGRVDPLAQLQDRLRLETELLGKSEAQRRVIQALGLNWRSYGEDTVNSLVATIEQLDETNRKIAEQQQLADTIKDSMSDAFLSMVDGTKTAKDAFRDMARSIIRQLYDVLVVQQMVGSFSASTGVGSGIVGSIGRALMGGRESGGSMMAGRPYLVGERGPELVIPGRSATVTNADLTRKSMGGSDAVNVVNNINVNGGTDPAAIRMEVAKLMPQITNATKSAVIDARRRGGQMKAAFG